MAPALKTGIGIVAAIAVLFAGLHYGARDFLAPAVSIEEQPEAVPDSRLVGTRAPYFDLPGREGVHRTLSELNDRPVVIVFVATWNEAAANQIKILDDYLASHKGDDLVRIAAIDTQEERSVINAFIRRGGYAVETLVDARGTTAEEYRVKSLPTAYFIDRDGIVRLVFAGLMNENMIAHNIETIVR